MLQQAGKVCILFRGFTTHALGSFLIDFVSGKSALSQNTCLTPVKVAVQLSGKAEFEELLTTH